MPDSGIRDQLAAERTHLANERTFLAYVRTGLALCAGGVTFLQFYRSSGTLPIGYLLLVLGSGGVVAGGFGSSAHALESGVPRGRKTDFRSSIRGDASGC